MWESWGCTDGLDLTFDSHHAKIMGQAQYQRILREFEVALRAQVHEKREREYQERRGR